MLSRNRLGFTLTELFVVIAIVFMLGALLLPTQRYAGEAARRNACSNQIRQLSLGVLNKESATQRFPLAMSGATAGRAISAHGPQPFDDNDGYSALVQILSYMEEPALADALTTASRQFQLPLRSDRFHVDPDGASLWSRPVELLICPTFPGENFAVGQYGPVKRPQVSNYHALVAGCVDGLEQSIADSKPVTGGVIVGRGVADKGIAMDEITDGTSKTAMFTESLEKEWAAWFSGASTTTVAMSPSNFDCSKLKERESGYLSVSPDDLSGLNYCVFWPRETGTREWGPSSAHEGDIVVTGYADGHVQALSVDIDPGVYFAISTRGGHEPTSGE